MQVDIAIRHTFTDPITLASFVNSLRDLFALAGSSTALTADPLPVAIEAPEQPAAVAEAAPKQSVGRPRGSRSKAADNPNYVPVEQTAEPAPAAQPAPTPAPAPVEKPAAATPEQRPLVDQIAAAFARADMLGASDDDYMAILGAFKATRARDIPVEKHAEALKMATDLVERLKAQSK